MNRNPNKLGDLLCLGGLFTCFPENGKTVIKNTKTPLRIKFGIDPTRDNLHLGHFVPLRVARKLQEEGHKLDVILGTLTARLGDPSGQDKTRPILSEEEVEKNASSLLEQIEKVLLPGFSVHKNHKFVQEMSIPFFLSRLASKFTVSNILARDGFKKRIENDSPISLHELLVPLLQGWDSVVLRSQVEIGGTDQLFNFQLTRTLQEIEGQAPEMCIMAPVIRGTDGRKMSKTFNNAIWLNEEPNQMFAKIMSISDDVANEWIKLLTDIEEFPEHPMEKKKILAFDIVEQLHGNERATKAKMEFEKLVQNKEAPKDIPVVNNDVLLNIVSAIRNESKNKVRKLIQQGGVSINGDKIKDPFFKPNSKSVIKIGKRQFVRTS